ncbi:hypothetical protein Kpol_1044p12 [Vanderwaltozyma polyspora DSM 70294]|uniref:Glutamate--tRNA ligase, mitochondrial n=1 Tax=Vanderwaltozyma polyspora (strain ATCC 22028 / DSM 70294 / BCRC 21397 / CBS 2163 / NBRC 10782 / NRRL Y-8283 / UCD 57-17) TaxID=436907 RepID=A7TP43_VANPO|nr:uncharacterized protein Kpol_1044p12 [Vanderwaltozyma polyspora DSM 70294]EDO15953.1 hypothetical protein Kpol_1044p12 [Vanderwaltozyma polyspora DSM 70294]
MIRSSSNYYSKASLRWASTLLKGKSLLTKKPKKNVQPISPVRTRFAPSPTGFLHLGSLRTALYNYLLAKNTGGQFLLRLEDTDRKRLVKDAEENIYESLKWCGIDYDEGPNSQNQQFGPYRQSDRTKIYQKYIDKLLDNGHAYRCFCPKERLDSLRDSAQKLQPPTTVSYDRNCLHLNHDEIQNNINNGVSYTVRMKSPEIYPPFDDLLHGHINIQPQINSNDRRYDDPILMKSDNLPTYHFANVIDDHLMKITHVIRGEEWLPSTPKHIALYEAFGWDSPKFVHLPLLTSTNDQKLSKRKGDSSVLSLRDKGILPEALVNFSVLFGWSPPREMSEMNHECFTLSEFEKLFNLNYLTKGNAKVDDKKLWFFNKHYLQLRLQNKDELAKIVAQVTEEAESEFGKTNVNEEKIQQILVLCGKSISNLKDFNKTFYYFFEDPVYNRSINSTTFIQNSNKELCIQIVSRLQGHFSKDSFKETMDSIVSELEVPKKTVFETIRFALSESQPGAKIPDLIEILGEEEVHKRIDNALAYLKTI